MKTILLSIWAELLVDHSEFMMTCIFVAYIIILLVIYWISRLKQQMTDLQIRLLINQRAQALEHQALMEQLKQQGNAPRKLEDLETLFGEKVNSLKMQYPSLTELDIQVLILIGLGVENHEILRLTDMSKRTYYKRRQLIAQRMGTTAALLDPKAHELFTSK